MISILCVNSGCSYWLWRDFSQRPCLWSLPCCPPPLILSSLSLSILRLVPRQILRVSGAVLTAMSPRLHFIELWDPVLGSGRALLSPGSQNLIILVPFTHSDGARYESWSLGEREEIIKHSEEALKSDGWSRGKQSSNCGKGYNENVTVNKSHVQFSSLEPPSCSGTQTEWSQQMPTEADESD